MSSLYEVNVYVDAKHYVSYAGNRQRAKNDIFWRLKMSGYILTWARCGAIVDGRWHHWRVRVVRYY